MNPRKKRATIISMAILMTLVGVAIWGRLSKHETRRLITPEDFGRLKSGLTQREVQAILGPPHEVLTWKSPKHRKLGVPESPRHIIWVYYGPIEENEPFRKWPFLYLKIDGEEGVLKTWGEGRDGDVVSHSLLDRIRKWLAKLF